MSVFLGIYKRSNLEFGDGFASGKTQVTIRKTRPTHEFW
jgi:hypothetical protein